MGEELIHLYGPSISTPIWAKHYYTHMGQAVLQHMGQALVNSYGPSIKTPVWAKHYYTHMVTTVWANH